MSNVSSSQSKLQKFFFSDLYLGFSRGKKIAFAAVFVALCVIVNIFSIKMLDTQLSFTFTVTFLTGVVFGPVVGFLVGFLGDLLGWIVDPVFAYLPFVGISTGLMGFISGMVMKLPFTFKGGVYVKVVLAELLCLLICTCGINTYGFYCMYGLGNTFSNFVSSTFPSLSPSYFLYIVYRLIFKFQLLLWTINAVLIFVAIPLVNHIKPLNVKIK